MRGFKAFNKDMTNRYGEKFKENENYHIDGELKFGNGGNGFHFCARLEDTLRYFDGINDEIAIAYIEANNISEEYCDEYYGYYDMFVASDIYIKKILSRYEIIEHILSRGNIISIIRFIQGYKLTKQELFTFKLLFSNSEKIVDTISYFQEKKLDTYTKKYKK